MISPWASEYGRGILLKKQANKIDSCSIASLYFYTLVILIIYNLKLKPFLLFSMRASCDRRLWEGGYYLLYPDEWWHVHLFLLSFI